MSSGDAGRPQRGGCSGQDPSSSSTTAARHLRTCGFVINGIATAPRADVCQLHMRYFKMETSSSWSLASKAFRHPGSDGRRSAWIASSSPALHQQGTGAARSDSLPSQGAGGSAFEPPPASAAAPASPPAPTRRRCSSRRPNLPLGLFPQGQPSGSAGPQHGGQMAAEGFGGCTNIGSARRPVQEHRPPFIAR